MLYYTVPVPRAVFDLTPSLKDAELRVLLVIVRKTLGYRDTTGKTKTGKKERDWISTSQFEKNGGLCRRAVGIATASLFDKGHIIVTDELGVVLDTPAKRKGKSRLYYELATALKPSCVDYAEHMRSKIASLAHSMRYT